MPAGGEAARSDGHGSAQLNGTAPTGGGRAGTALLTAEDPPAEDDGAADAEAPAPATARRARSPLEGPTRDLFPPGFEERLRHGRRRIVTLATAGVAAIAAVAAVGAWSMVGRSSTPAAAASASAVASSVRSTVAKGTANLSLTMGIRLPGSGVVNATGSGAVDLRSDASRLLFTFRGPGALAGDQLQEVFVGDTIYLSLPQLAALVPGKPWISQPLTPTALIAPRNSDPGALLGMLGANGNRVVALGASTVGGTAVHGYRVTVSPANLGARLSKAGLPAGITGAAEHAAGTTSDVVTVYVADRTGQVRRLVADIVLSLGSNPVVATVTEDLDNVGTPTSVVAPSAAQVLTLPQFQAAVAGAGPSVSV